MLFSLKPSTKYYMLVCGIQFYGNTHQIIIVIYIKKYTAHNDNKRKQRKIQAQNAHRTTQHTYNAYNTYTFIEKALKADRTVLLRSFGTCVKVTKPSNRFKLNVVWLRSTNSFCLLLKTSLEKNKIGRTTYIKNYNKQYFFFINN